MTDFSTITTRGGDEGKSSLIGGERRFKSDEVFVILGDVDELTSVLGLARASMSQYIQEYHAGGRAQNTAMEYLNHLEDYRTRIHTVQDLLQKIGGLLALPIHKADTLGPEYLGSGYGEDFWRKQVAVIEEWQTQDIGEIHLRGFILPGDTLTGAHLDVSRAVCRRLERDLVGYLGRLNLGYLKVPQQFINRLSDWLFIMARWLEQNNPEEGA